MRWKRLSMVCFAACLFFACDDSSSANNLDSIENNDQKDLVKSSSSKGNDAVISSSSVENTSVISYGTMKDSRDGRTYKTITLGKYTWMAENLKFDYTVGNESYGKKCSENNPDNCEKKGRLYTWAAAMDSAGVFSEDGLGCGYKTACYPYKRVRGVCPEGWHLPRNYDFSYDEQLAFKTTFDSISTDVTYAWHINDFLYPLFWMAFEDGFETASYSYATKYRFFEHAETRVYDFIPVRCVMDYEEEILNVLDLRVPKESRFNPDVNYGEMTDSRDGKVYKTVKIGDQVWMAENLNYEAPTPPDSSKFSWCYADKEKLCDAMGRYYSFKAIFNERIDSLRSCSSKQMDCRDSAKIEALYQSVCPDGWHLPSMTEWEKLFDELGGKDVAAQKLVSKSGWFGGEPLDSYGFSVIPTGKASVNTSVYIYVHPNRYMSFGFQGYSASFWTANAVKIDDKFAGFSAEIAGSASNTMFSAEVLLFSYDYNYSVRCIKNK